MAKTAEQKQRAGTNHANRRKLMMIEMKGGRCERCGYDKTQYLRAFHFHHRDPKHKDFNIGSGAPIEELIIELEKCDLLCCRCHAEVHDEMNLRKREQRLAVKFQPIGPKTCPTCGKVFKARLSKDVYCSNPCAAKSRRRVTRPSEQELRELVSKHTYRDIAKQFGVSDVTVRNWAKHLGINVRKLVLKEATRRGNPKTYHLISPDGCRVTVYNIAEFCRQQGFNDRSICDMTQGRRHEYKGWSLDTKGEAA